MRCVLCTRCPICVSIGDLWGMSSNLTHPTTRQHLPVQSLIQIAVKVPRRQTLEIIGPNRWPMLDRFKPFYCIWVTFDEIDKQRRLSIWLSATLFPVLQCANVGP